MLTRLKFEEPLISRKKTYHHKDIIFGVIRVVKAIVRAVRVDGHNAAEKTRKILKRFKE